MQLVVAMYHEHSDKIQLPLQIRSSTLRMPVMIPEFLLIYGSGQEAAT
jgi:hypothetical protein